MNQQERNHHANQCNPNNVAYKAAMNNHANQCNPNHASYQGHAKQSSAAAKGSKGKQNHHCSLA